MNPILAENPPSLEGEPVVTDRVLCRGHTFNPRTGMVTLPSGEKVHLTGKEREMLLFLLEEEWKTVTKEMMMGRLYNGENEPALKILDVFMCKIRKKLPLLVPCIGTVWGRGYVWKPSE